MSDLKKIYINEIDDEAGVIYVSVSEQNKENIWNSQQSSMQNPISVRDTAEKSVCLLKDEMAKIKEVLKCTYTSLMSDKEKPDELEIEMGIELSSSVGVVLVSGNMNANIKVKAIWKKKQSEER